MSGCPFATRRGLLGGAVGLAGAVGAGRASAASGQPPLTKTEALPQDRLLPFHGAHQNGIVTPIQAHTYFAAFDATTTKVADIAALMRRWTDAAAKLTQGLPAGPADARASPQAIRARCWACRPAG